MNYCNYCLTVGPDFIVTTSFGEISISNCGKITKHMHSRNSVHFSSNQYKVSLENQ